MTNSSSLNARTTARILIPSSRAARSRRCPKRNLIALRIIRFDSNQNWGVLSVLADDFAKGSILLIGGGHSVRDEGIVDRGWIKVNDGLPLNELLLDFVGTAGFVTHAFQRLRYRAQRAR